MIIVLKALQQHPVVLRISKFLPWPLRARVILPHPLQPDIIPFSCLQLPSLELFLEQSKPFLSSGHLCLFPAWNTLPPVPACLIHAHLLGPPAWWPSLVILRLFPSLQSRTHLPCSSLAHRHLVWCLAQCTCQITIYWEMNERMSTWSEWNKTHTFQNHLLFPLIFFFLSCSQIWSFPSILDSVVCYKIFYDKQWLLLIHAFKNSVQEFRT